MDFTKMTAAELEERRAAIKVECEAEGADLDALDEEIRAINAELEARKQAAADAAEKRAAIAEGCGTVIDTHKEDRTMPEEIRNSKAYIEAYAEYIKTGDATECRALLTTGASGTVEVPAYVEERVRTAWNKEGIMSLVRKTFVKGILKVGFERSATGAVIHTEGGEAPDEETLVLGTVSLTPQSIKKWITVSDEALDLRGEEFLDYIYDELTYQIAKKAADTLIAMIVAAPTTATASSVSVNKVSAAPSIGAIAEALGQLSDEAANPVVVMNKATWAAFKAAQYAANFAADPFEGLQVFFNNTLPVYSSASTNAVYAIVGDFGHGAQANFPRGEEILIKMDDLSLAEEDLVKFVGREFVGLGLVADKSFASITKPSA